MDVIIDGKAISWGGTGNTNDTMGKVLEGINQVEFEAFKRSQSESEAIIIAELRQKYDLYVDQVCSSKNIHIPVSAEELQLNKRNLKEKYDLAIFLAVFLLRKNTMSILLDSQGNLQTIGQFPNNLQVDESKLLYTPKLFDFNMVAILHELQVRGQNIKSQEVIRGIVSEYESSTKTIVSKKQRPPEGAAAVAEISSSFIQREFDKTLTTFREALNLFNAVPANLAEMIACFA